MTTQPKEKLDYAVTKQEAMELLIPLVFRLRLYLCAQVNGGNFTKPLVEVVIGEVMFRLCDDITTTLAGWLPYYDSDGPIKWGKKFNELTHFKDEKTINLYLKGIEDKSMRVLLRMGWAAHQLGFVEEMVQDGDQVTKFISAKVYKKMDDAFIGFLYSWANADDYFMAGGDGAWFCPDDDPQEAINNGVPTS